MSDVQQRGVTLLPKRALAVMQGEVLRALKLTQNAVIPIGFQVPRKVSFRHRRDIIQGTALMGPTQNHTRTQTYSVFHDDLFPDTRSDIPGSTASAWFSGSDDKPALTTLDPNGRQTSRSGGMGAPVVKPATVVQTGVGAGGNSSNGGDAKPAASASDSREPSSSSLATASASASASSSAADLVTRTESVSLQEPTPIRTSTPERTATPDASSTTAAPARPASVKYKSVVRESKFRYITGKALVCFCVAWCPFFVFLCLPFDASSQTSPTSQYGDDDGGTGGRQHPSTQYTHLNNLSAKMSGETNAFAFSSKFLAVPLSNPGGKYRTWACFFLVVLTVVLWHCFFFFACARPNWHHPRGQVWPSASQAPCRGQHRRDPGLLLQVFCLFFLSRLSQHILKTHNNKKIQARLIRRSSQWAATTATCVCGASLRVA